MMMNSPTEIESVEFRLMSSTLMSALDQAANGTVISLEATTQLKFVHALLLKVKQCLWSA